MISDVSEEHTKLDVKMENYELSGSESESSSEDDEKAELLTEELEEGFLKVLSRLKKKDDSVYDKNVTYYEESVGERESGSAKKAKKSTLKEWLEGKKDKVKDANLEQELEGLHEFWASPKLNKDEKFLRDYILNKKFLEEDKDFDLQKALQTLDSEEEEINKQLKHEEMFNLRYENGQNQNQVSTKKAKNKKKTKENKQQEETVNEDKQDLENPLSSATKDEGALKKAKKRNRASKVNLSVDEGTTKQTENEAAQEPSVKKKTSKTNGAVTAINKMEEEMVQTSSNLKTKVSKAARRKAKKIEKLNGSTNSLSTIKRKMDTNEDVTLTETEEPIIKKQKINTEAKEQTRKKNKKKHSLQNSAESEELPAKQIDLDEVSKAARRKAKKIEKLNGSTNSLSTIKRKMDTNEDVTLTETEEPIIKKQKINTEAKEQTRKKNKKKHSLQNSAESEELPAKQIDLDETTNKIKKHAENVKTTPKKLKRKSYDGVIRKKNRMRRGRKRKEDLQS